MAENVIYADLNLPESTKPRLQQVTDVQGSTYAELRVKSQGTDPAGSHSSAGKSCCSRKCVAALVALLVVIILLLVLAGCLIHQYHSTVSSPQDSTTLHQVPKETPACPKQWEKHGRKCYFFPSFKRKDWNGSREECAAMGADLVVIDNEDELRYLTERAGHKYYLLGLTYSEREQKWKWMNSMDHDPALFDINGPYRDYHCTVIGHGKVQTASCGGSSTTENMCERAAMMSER